MKKYLIVILLALLQMQSYGQLSEEGQKAIIRMTNSQKTANSKDILTTLYRAGIDNLLGKTHAFEFSSTFYGIDSIFHRKTPRKFEPLLEKRLRGNSFNISIKGDNSNNITELSGGFTFKLMNKKDLKFTSAKLQHLENLTKLSYQSLDLLKKIVRFIEKHHNGIMEDTEKNNKIMKTWNDANRNNDYSKLDPLIVEALRSKEIINELNKSEIFLDNEAQAFVLAFLDNKNPLHELFENISAIYAKKPLWTFSPTFTYDRENKQGTFSFASDLTFGLGKDISKKPWEFEFKASFKIQNDTSVKKTNYKDKPFSISAGVNKVLIQNEDKESKMEFKFFTQYEYQFGNVPAEADAGIFTLNSTLRINVFKSLWLPLTLKYDPINSNFLGIFAVTANLGN